MADVTGTLLKHRKRLNEIAGALARHGLAAWAARAAVASPTSYINLRRV